uniref:SH2 domain-containing protein n=1 Tax=Leptobrachium leishanense TaxID=445787 RepID=A0A8C5QQY2_9ANUR
MCEFHDVSCQRASFACSLRCDELWLKLCTSCSITNKTTPTRDTMRPRSAPDCATPMEPGYQQEFPAVSFSTFKAPSIERDEPLSPTSRQHGECSKKARPEAQELTLQNNHTSPINVQNKEMPMNAAGTLKEETRLWFQNTQRAKLIKNKDYPPWFHGFLTRRRAEEMLQDKPAGCFLIRFCESRVGYVLSYRGGERCRHFMLDQQGDETYVIEGETSAHRHLEDLLDHYREHPVEPYKELLTEACVKVERQTEAPKDDPAYGKVTKPCMNPAEKRLTPTVSPREPKQTPPKVVHGAPPFPPNSTVTGLTEPEKCTITKQPSIPYAAVAKNSDAERQRKKDKPSPGKDYATMEELHTYSEPAACVTRESEKRAEAEDPIAFYAMGRGSTKESSENVYSEVDTNSKPSGNLKTKTYKQGASTTLPHPVNKATHNKTAAFHSSFRVNKRSVVTTDMGKAQDTQSKDFSKSKAKVMQFDEPLYSTSSDCPNPHSKEAEDQENIYERIPDHQGTMKPKDRPARRNAP